MRARNIKPGFFANDVVATLPHWVRLLMIGLWLFADRAGRFEVRLGRIKRELFPDEDVDVTAGLEMLVKAEPPFLRLYEVGGVRYAQVLNWDKHQNPHHREAQSTLPPPPSDAPTMHEPLKRRRRPKQVAPCPTDSGFLIPDTGYRIPDSLIDAYPDWLPVTAWKEWDEYRASMHPRRPWTDKAKRLSLTKLDQLRAEGCDPTEVIEQSIERGYTGLFGTKGNNNGTRNDGGVAGRVVAHVRANAGKAAARDHR